MPKSIKVGENLIKTDLRYAPTHEWINLQEKPSTVGISDYAQRTLHDLVYVEFPEVGQSVKKGETICSLESIKAVAEVYAPVDCTVAEVNKALMDRPELINKDPYGEGWLVKVDVKGGGDLLLTPEAYAEVVKKQL
jgi:glycine cleavage system H protein